MRLVSTSSSGVKLQYIPAEIMTFIIQLMSHFLRFHGKKQCMQDSNVTDESCLILPGSGGRREQNNTVSGIGGRQELLLIGGKQDLL